MPFTRRHVKTTVHYADKVSDLQCNVSDHANAASDWRNVSADQGNRFGLNRTVVAGRRSVRLGLVNNSTCRRNRVYWFAEDRAAATAALFDCFDLAPTP